MTDPRDLAARLVQRSQLRDELFCWVSVWGG